jgi:hypothetical protein
MTEKAHDVEPATTQGENLAPPPVLSSSFVLTHVGRVAAMAVMDNLSPVIRYPVFQRVRRSASPRLVRAPALRDADPCRATPFAPYPAGFRLNG